MIFVPVSHLPQSYHNLETNLVYLVSTVECLWIHFYATVEISYRYCADYCRATSLRWSAANIGAPHQTPAGLRPTWHAYGSLLRPLRGFDGLKPFLLQVKQRRIRAAIVQVITGVIGQSAKAVAPRVVLS